MRAMRVIGRLAVGGFLGMLVLLALNTACNLMQNSGSPEYLLTWVGKAFHDKIVNKGDDLGIEVYGAGAWSGAPWHVRTVFHVAPAAALGLAAGLAAGLLGLWIEWLRGARRPVTAFGGVGEGNAAASAVDPGRGPVIPAHWPPMVAAIGIFVQGHVLGLVALYLAGRTGAGRWLVWTSRVLGAGVSLFWSLASEQYWVSGWSKEYAILKQLMDWAGGHLALGAALAIAMGAAAVIVISARCRKLRRQSVNSRKTGDG